MLKQTLKVTFDGADQRTGDRLIVPGKLSVAENVVQREARRYGKRHGFGNLATTTDSGAISDGVQLVGAGSTPFLRTSTDVFARNVAGTWRNRGAVTLVMPTARRTIWPFFYSDATSVTTGTYTYHFVISFDVTAAKNFIWYRITEDATGLEVLAPTRFADGLASLGNDFVPVYSGGFVWLFHRAQSSLTLKVAKFDPASLATAGVITTFTAFSVTLGGFDVIETSGGPCVYGWGCGAAGQTFQLGYLDTATGILKVAPGLVSTTTSGSGAAHAANSFWLRSSASAADGFFWLFITSAANSGTIKITPATLAPATGTVFSAGDLALTGYTSTARVTGYVEGGVRVLFSTEVTGGSGSIENGVMRRLGVNLARATIPATEPFKVGSTWYLITLHDDNNGLQRYYQVRQASDGKIVGRFLYPEAGNYLQTVASNIPRVFVSGTTARVDLRYDNGTNAYGVQEVTLEFSPSTGPLVATRGGDQVLIPGSWPQGLLGESQFMLAEPPMWPRTITLSSPGAGGTLATATYSLQAVYVIRDAANNVHWSSPCPIVTRSHSSATQLRAAIPTLRHVNTGDDVWIELYMNRSGGTTLYLAGTARNDATVDSINIDLSAEPAISNPIYTTGSVLSNVAPPPFRCQSFWQDRAWVFDTDVDGDVWPSRQIYDPGIAPSFSDLLAFRIPAAGRLRAGGPISRDYFGLLSELGAWTVYGDGPDDIGRGAFTVKEIDGAPGCTNPNVASSSQGLHYQATDGGIHLISAPGAVTYIGGGVEDHKSATVTAAVHAAKAKLVLFFTSTSKALVWDYGFPPAVAATPVETLGQWYVWNLPAAAVAATIISDTVYFMTSAGVVYKQVADQWFDGTSTPIRQKTKLPLPIAGMLGDTRVSRGQVSAEFRGNNTMQITTSAVGADRSAPAVKVDSEVITTAAAQEKEFRLSRQRASFLEVTIEEIGNELTEGYVLDGLALEVAVKPGPRRLKTSSRI